MKYLNRELSWLEFNSRVLDEGHLEDVPLLERLRFLAIFCRNLDEFFMVRVAGKKRAALESLLPTDSPDELSPEEVLTRIKQKVEIDIAKLYSHFSKRVLPLLNEAGIQITPLNELNPKILPELDQYFDDAVFPILTPLAVDSSHPFPFLVNLRVYLLVVFEVSNNSREAPTVGFVEIPSNLSRLVLIRKDDQEYQYLYVEELIIRNLSKLFHGLSVSNVYQIRVTRDLDFTLLENEVVDLLQSVQNKIKMSEQAEIVRLEVSHNMPDKLCHFLMGNLGLDHDDIYRANGPLALQQLENLAVLPFPKLRYPAFNPRLPKPLQQNRSIFSIVDNEDLLVHHPYESFYTVIEFLSAAADDPQVLAIKQTLYRISGDDSPIIDALITAAENGKQVTAIVELKARFDEKNNIVWARRMERSGVNVVYGFVGLKTHSKATLIIRQGKKTLKRYAHLGTGNYNWSTARFYSDLSFITADPVITSDVAGMFNLLTGFNIFTNPELRNLCELPQFCKAQIAPLNLKAATLSLIEDEINQAIKGKKAQIIAKCNALVDRDIIDKLYEASNHGVKINLIIRGICCLIPGLPGMSENIEVRSVIDRFLEHSRVFYFHAGGAEKVYLSSADWMPRNLNRRVELAFPIEDDRLKKRILHEILEVYLSDNCKAQILTSQGTYRRVKRSPDDEEIRSQIRFIELAREEGVKSIPYEKAVRFPIKDDGRPFVKANQPSIRPGKNKKGKKR